METASLILKNMNLWMSCINNVNDPKESSNRNFTFYARNNKTSIFFKDELFDEVEKDITSNTFALCCVRSGNVSEQGQHENALRANLWAYYGENHNGVCFVIDKDKLNKKIDESAKGNLLRSGSINYLEPEIWASEISSAYSIYLEDYLHDRNGYLDNHIKTNLEELFFTKQIAWRDELEYRWVMRSRASKYHIDISIIDCLELVIIGSSMSVENEKIISDLCSQVQCIYHKANWRTSGGIHKPTNLKPHLDLNGIQFSLNVPCESVLVKAVDQTGANHSIHITSSDGNVRSWGSGDGDETVLRNRAKELSFEWNDCDLPQHYRPIFSASRLAKSLKKPLNMIIKDGKAVPHESEEKVYYPEGFSFKPELK